MDPKTMDAIADALGLSDEAKKAKEEEVLKSIATKAVELSASLKTATDKITKLGKELKTAKSTEADDGKKGVSVPPAMLSACASARNITIGRLVEKARVCPAVATGLREMFIGPDDGKQHDCLQVALSSSANDHFDELMSLLALNDPNELHEQSAAQIATLSGGPRKDEDVGTPVADACKEIADRRAALAK